MGAMPNGSDHSRPNSDVLRSRCSTLISTRGRSLMAAKSCTFARLARSSPAAPSMKSKIRRGSRRRAVARASAMSNKRELMGRRVYCCAAHCGRRKSGIVSALPAARLLLDYFFGHRRQVSYRAAERRLWQCATRSYRCLCHCAQQQRAGPASAACVAGRGPNRHSCHPGCLSLEHRSLAACSGTGQRAFDTWW